MSNKHIHEDNKHDHIAAKYVVISHMCVNPRPQLEPQMTC